MVEQATPRGLSWFERLRRLWRSWQSMYRYRGGAGAAPKDHAGSSDGASPR